MSYTIYTSSQDLVSNDPSLGEREAILQRDDLREGMEVLVKHKRSVASAPQDLETRDRIELEILVKELSILESGLEHDKDMLDRLRDQGNESNAVYFEDNIERKKNKIDELAKKQKLLEASLVNIQE